MFIAGITILKAIKKQTPIFKTDIKKGANDLMPFSLKILINDGIKLINPIMNVKNNVNNNNADVILLLLNLSSDNSILLLFSPKY